MPLARLKVRNEFGLGDPALYNAPPIKDDSKAVFNGVAVAGLVGIIRQLGDLVEFAGDVFHGLHEEVTATEARGRKMLTRVQNIETALPLVEKAIKQQRSHAHFAYVSGSEWHARLLDEQNLLLANELPRFMMDSYEECHDPPHLYLLDKFDHAGSGACLKRYSDPSYFRRVMTLSEMEKAEYMPREKKIQKLKEKGSRIRNRDMHPAAYISGQHSRTRFSSIILDGLGLSTDNDSISNGKINSEILSRSYFDSKTRESCIEKSYDVSPHPTKIECTEVPDRMLRREGICPVSSDAHSDPTADDHDDISNDSVHEHSVPRSSSGTWDEKVEIISTTRVSCDGEPVDRFQDSNCHSISSEHDNLGGAKAGPSKEGNTLLDSGSMPTSLDSLHQSDEGATKKDKYMDALNTLDSETEAESHLQSKIKDKMILDLNSQVNYPRIEIIQNIKVRNPELPNVESLDVSPTTCGRDVSKNSANFYSSASPDHVQSPQAVEFANTEYTSIVKPCESRTNSHSVGEEHEQSSSDRLHEASISSPPTFVDDETPIKKSILKAPLSSSLAFPSVQLWTNGGLFGVEPSKPPDLRLLSGSDQKLTPVSRNQDDHVNLNRNFRSYPLQASSNGNPLDHLKFEQGFQDSKQDPPLNEFDKTSVISPISSNNNSSGVLSLMKTCASSDVMADGKGVQDGPVQSTKVVSSTFADLAQKFLSNTLQRKPSISGGLTYTVAGIVSGSERKQWKSKLQNNCLPNATVSEASYKMDGEDNGSHVSSNGYSGQSSPPLEHIKISFYPINGTEASKVHSVISDRSCQDDSDNFLLPSLTLPQNSVYPCPDSCSDSDDSTFCRSCPYSSEDLPSPGSCSNSEMWNKEHSCEYREEDPCDDFYKFSSPTASMSSFIGLKQINLTNINKSSEMQNDYAESYESRFKSISPVELPDFDYIMSLGTTQGTSKLLRDNELHHEEYLEDQLPPPPPLPPAQWRILKSSTTSEAEAAKMTSTSNLDALAQEFTSQQLDSPRLPNIVEGNILRMHLKSNDVYYFREVDNSEQLLPRVNSQKPEQNINGHQTNGSSKIAKDVNKPEGLLDQIRNKSFNLRRTRTSDPDAVSKTNAKSANFVAILEKATTIRQAFVGSDEGGDDEKWSDG